MMKRVFVFSLVALCLVSWSKADSTFVERGLLYRRISVDSVNVIKGKDGYSAETFQDSVLYISGRVRHDEKDYYVRCIESRTFLNCSGIKHAVIGNGIEEIHDDAFSLCANLESLEIPASVNVIGGPKPQPIARYCNNLSTISVNVDNVIYDSRDGCNAIIRTKGNSLLNGCIGTRIPSSVEEIGRFAFSGSFMDSIVIPDGTRRIDSNAFAYCPNLKSVYISSTVDWIDDESFAYCPNIMSITVDERNEVYDSRDNCNAIISGEYLIKGCNTTVIPTGVEVIGRAAFAHCHRLKDIIIPEGVSMIRSGAFWNCLSLKHVSLPSTLTCLDEVGGSQFAGCVSLDSIYIPENVNEMRNDIFNDCVSLRSITVATGNKTYDSRDNCNAVIRTSTNELIAGCSGTVIPEGVRYIAYGSFAGSGITSINIPASVVSIDPTAFSGCERCMSITVEPGNRYYKSEDSNSIVERKTGKLVLGCATTSFLPGLTSIGENAFISTPEILVLPDGIREIGCCAFLNCKDLTAIIIPPSVKHIGKLAFSRCDNLSYKVIMGGDIKID